MTNHRVSIMGVGFIGNRYCQLYPSECTPEPREALTPAETDVLFLRSTVSNYNVLNSATRKLDIETNLCHLMDVLPNVRGRFAFVSSWFVYHRGGLDAGHPAHEDYTSCRPVGMYAVTKLAAEQVVRSYCGTAALGLVPGPSSHQILRLCSVIGNDPRAGKHKGAIEMLLAKVVRGEDVSVYEGDNYRAVMHVDDVCRAIHMCLTKGKLDTIYNIGPTSSVRVFDLIQHALFITGSKSRVTIVAQPPFHKLVQTTDFHMDTTKLRALGFTPSMDAYQAVERVIANMTTEDAIP